MPLHWPQNKTKRGNSLNSLHTLPSYSSTASTNAIIEPRAHPVREQHGWLTNGCIRTTITVAAFGLYAIWWCYYGAAPSAPEAGHDDANASVTTGEGARTWWGTPAGVIKAPPLGVPKAIQTKWAMYSPWHALQTYEPPPAGCNITQVGLSLGCELQRHGARFPNEEDGELYALGVRQLATAEKFTDKRLRFMKGYEYTLGADDLVPFGAAQTFESGQIAYKRYKHLVDPHNVPFVRAADAPRVMSTATNWTVGFAVGSHQRVQPYLNVALSEDVNNTLNQDCPSAPDGSFETSIWLSIFGAALAARLNALAPGANLNATHVFGLLAMCPFESVALEEESAFCRLFTEEDFRNFEYFGDLEKYYRTGYGAQLGRVRGVGYVNELLARLTDSPVEDHTTHNASLEFPLGRAIYADFTHENLMVAVYSALGLFNISATPLDPRARPVPTASGDASTWVASRMVPFSSRMVTERLQCTAGGPRGAGTFVRVLVNDEPQPLEFCGGGLKRGERMCALGAFVESQGYARRSGDGDFLKCYN
ncbi:acid phosphatase [Epithele typhae]|uniref:acid phosphatase n=1 Tax=Epithele typhae TaxID=378194 RepID=UPI002007C90D|nr:acid phosphatase [Epithele typhae]KAH9919169.1 acid phosphatase [Epithele typhae]